MNNTGILILAAGNSSRLGSPKQLLAYQNTSLLGHVAKEALKAGLSPVIIVTGAFADLVTSEVKHKEIQIIHNDAWEEGMGTSIVRGLTEIIKQNHLPEKLLIAVCDQPFVSASLFTRMIEAGKQTGKGIVACAYSDTLGVPVLFHNKYFSFLLQLKGEEGAKKLLQSHLDDVASVPFPEGNIDIDTGEEFDRLVKGEW